MRRNTLVVLALVSLVACGGDESSELDASQMRRVRDMGQNGFAQDMLVIPTGDASVPLLDGTTPRNDGSAAQSDAGVGGDGGDISTDAATVGPDGGGNVNPDAATPVAEEDDVFPAGANGVLARHELNGNIDDSSGNGRDLILMDGNFVATDFGRGLEVGNPAHGLNWTAHANLLRHPYTIEMVFTFEEQAGQSFAKIFDTDSSSEDGWYIQADGFRNWPSDNDPIVGRGLIASGEQTYLAVVSTSPSDINVYINGVRASERPVGARFDAPPTEVILFRDDGDVSAGEEPHAIIDAIRISSTNRTDAEIAAVQARLDGR